MKQIKHCLLALFGGLLLATFAANAQDARPNSIEAMIVAQHAGVLNVKLTFKDPLTAVPPGFSIAKPARIALDFANTTNGRSEEHTSELQSR